jgi:hypothetical protein
MNNYEHTQVGLVTIIAVCAAAILLVIFLAAGRIVLPAWSAAVTLLVAPLALALFSTLTVSVDNKRVQLRFGIGLIRKSIPLSHIASYAPSRLRWVYGYGIHWIPFRGWLYNVSGFKAVEIITKNGRHTLIGTDEPEVLCHALQQLLPKEAAVRPH